jgi:hypothetical protein
LLLTSSRADLEPSASGITKATRRPDGRGYPELVEDGLEGRLLLQLDQGDLIVDESCLRGGPEVGEDKEVNENKGFWAVIIGGVFVLCLVVGTCSRPDPNNEWGSKFNSEGYRKSVRDEMIRRGTDPAIAEAYTKDKYDEERKKNGGK